MKCHYEVLGIERVADDTAIRKSYRKFALRWHPDKNLENLEEATKEFRIVQQAYDVLSDPQERAWYDKHREAILRGGMGNSGEYEDDAVDIYAFFNSSCYNGFHDGDDGFYTVYRELFERIAEEDYSFVDPEDYQLPGFGDSLSEFKEVVAVFYGHWESYNTKKSYVWEEKWDIRTAPDRLTRRAMEKENRKVVETKKKEKNEEIRALVKFVKKRDKRVAENRLRLQERAKELERTTKEKQLREGQERMEQLSNYVEAEWSASTTLEASLRSLENNLAQEFQDGFESPASDDEEDMNRLFCVACNKSFKTHRSFSNHQRSKKHREIMAILRQELLDQDELDLLKELNLGEEEGGDTKQFESGPTNKKKKKKEKQSFASCKETDGVGERERYNTDVVANIEESESLNVKPSNSPNEQFGESEINQKVDEASEEDLTHRSASTNGVAEGVDDTDDNIDDFVHKSTSKTKSKNKKNKKQGGSSSVPPQPKDVADSLQCKVCLEKLSSRNKLFDHIKSTGHAALKLDAAPPSQSNARSKKKGRRKTDTA